MDEGLKQFAVEYKNRGKHYGLTIVAAGWAEAELVLANAKVVGRNAVETDTRTLHQITTDAMVAAVIAAGGNISKAARALRISKRTIQRNVDPAVIASARGGADARL